MKGDLVVCSNAGQMLTRLLLLFCYLILLNFFPVKLYGLQDNDPSMLHTQYHKIFQEMLQEYLFWILVILCDPKSFLLQVHFISRGGFISKGMNYLATVIWLFELKLVSLEATQSANKVLMLVMIKFCVLLIEINVHFALFINVKQLRFMLLFIPGLCYCFYYQTERVKSLVSETTRN